MSFIDRRRNPKSKSLGNRQRFLRRAKAHMRKAFSESLRGRKITDLESEQQIEVSSRDLVEPVFDHQRNRGRRDYVLPGNQSFQAGDLISKPDSHAGGSSKNGSADGDGQDSFSFIITSEEFLDLFFEDLKLPNLAKRKLKSIQSSTWVRAGYATTGAPQRLDLRRTLRRSLARRIALKRPRSEQLSALEAEHRQAIEQGDDEAVKQIELRLLALRQRMRAIPYLDSVDLRYSRIEKLPKPTSQAVMFCLMDTSASMTEKLKDLAKRFYMLLHLFLSRHYQSVELVFIRHTYTAAEVDEQTFFYGRDTGGTVVSSALAEMHRIVRQRYPVEDWNIYAAQASDGHNFDHDMPDTMRWLQQQILPICQYYAYIEVNDDQWPGESVLWQSYQALGQQFSHFSQAKVESPSEIFPVFHHLFQQNRRVGN